MKRLIFDTVDSTNTLAKKLAAQGEPLPFSVTARAQTAGRGRIGHSFFSPGGTGLYVSFVFSDSMVVPDMPELITCGAGTATVQTLESFGVFPRIKPVNDLFLGGKKIAGILTETSGGALVIGIGINLLPPDGGFPAELECIAGAAFECNAPDADSVYAGLEARLTRELALPAGEIMNRYGNYLR